MKFSKIFSKWIKEEEAKAAEYVEFPDWVSFEARGFKIGRYLSNGKSGPENHIMVWNGNIITEKYGKIWFGDLNLTTESESLQQIADEIGEDLYILKEHDARFQNEYAGIKFWKDKAVAAFISSKCKCKK